MKVRLINIQDLQHLMLEDAAAALRDSKIKSTRKEKKLLNVMTATIEATVNSPEVCSQGNEEKQRKEDEKKEKKRGKGKRGKRWRWSRSGREERRGGSAFKEAKERA